MGETARRLPLRCGRRATISCFCCRLIRRLAAIAGCSREPTGTVRRPLVLLRPRAEELHCELLGPCVGWAAARPPHDRADTASNTKAFSHLDSSRGGDECKRDPPKGYPLEAPLPSQSFAASACVRVSLYGWRAEKQLGWDDRAPRRAADRSNGGAPRRRSIEREAHDQADETLDRKQARDRSGRGRGSARRPDWGASGDRYLAKLGYRVVRLPAAMVQHRLADAVALVVAALAQP